MAKKSAPTSTATTATDDVVKKIVKWAVWVIIAIIVLVMMPDCSSGWLASCTESERTKQVVVRSSGPIVLQLSPGETSEIIAVNGSYFQWTTDDENFLVRWYKPNGMPYVFPGHTDSAGWALKDSTCDRYLWVQDRTQQASIHGIQFRVPRNGEAVTIRYTRKLF
ncbi:MAG TPA: hypothetical protein PKA60_01465 [Candidatus Paceibacterota bacterium]|nr:hypothetical protein [Candidatus Paceibacterota bacterium]